MTLRRDRLSDLYVITCDDCGRRMHIDSDTGVGASSLAHHAGWFVSMLADYCRDCDHPTSTPRRKKAR